MIFLIGWIAFELSIVALSDRVSTIKYIPELPSRHHVWPRRSIYPIPARSSDPDTGPEPSIRWSFAHLSWPGIGFGIAKTIALVYCILLCLQRSSVNESQSGDAITS